MNEIESALLSAISKHPKMPLIIAYSGGVDSQVLLHAFASLIQNKSTSSELLNSVTVCHVNHGLSVNASTWQEFAQQQCQRVNLPLKVCQVNVQVKVQHSLEALARDARYQALHSVYDEASLILTGHHRDDQAETFLLALKRGSGLKGLSAMAEETKQTKDWLVRPLLNISRAQIIAYAKAHDLTWVEDESNSDVRFDRNFIRNDILPLLTKRWPSITNTINRSSEHCREGQVLLNELAAADLELCQDEVNSFKVEALINLSQARFNNLIRYFLALKHYLMPSTEQLQQLHQQLGAAKEKNPAVKVGENYFRRYKGALYLTADFNDVSAWQVNIDLHEHCTNIELPDNLGQLQLIVGKNEVSENRAPIINKQHSIIAPSKDQVITVRFEHNNPKCLPDYRQHSRSLKKVLQELDIPPWQRKRIPFLYFDDILVAVMGHFVCQPYLSQDSSPQGKELSITITWTS